MERILEDVNSKVTPEHMQKFEALQTGFEQLKQQVRQLRDDASDDNLAEQLTNTNGSIKQFHNMLIEQEGSATTSTRGFWYDGDKHAPDLPWQLVRVAILTSAFVWFY